MPLEDQNPPEKQFELTLSAPLTNSLLNTMTSRRVPSLPTGLCNLVHGRSEEEISKKGLLASTRASKFLLIVQHSFASNQIR